MKQKLDEFYAKNPHRVELANKHPIVERIVENRLKLFRPENIPLDRRDKELRQQYEKITGAWTVEFRGEERTMPQMTKFLEEPDRQTRQEAWQLMVERRLRDKDALEEIFDQMLAIRQQIAANAGFNSYRDYAFRLLQRFDYGPEECFRYHAAVEQYFMPLTERLWQQRKLLLGVETLRPWDTQVDPKNRPPLRPFENAGELVTKTEEVFRLVDPEFGTHFRFIRDQGLLDLESRKGKAPDGYQYSLDQKRLPFIFMNAAGSHVDVLTLLHEGGHAFHTILARELTLAEYREPPIEFAEVASMSMELLALPHLHVFYPNEEDYLRARRYKLEGIALLFPFVAIIDAFQHWLYTNPGHTREERSRAWLKTFFCFNRGIEWSALKEDALKYLWHRYSHLFLVPFYFIEYGIAQLGALQIWLNSKKDYREAVRRYKYALSLGGSRPLPELFEAAGAEFPLGPNCDSIVAAAAKTLEEELEKLPL